MIREIKNDVTAAIQEAFTCALHTNPGSFVLFLARGDYNHLFDGDRFANLDPKPSPYCLDFMPDIYRDETRNKFYVRYLNRRYKNDNFKYDGDEGIDDLCVEMMIYSHVWESKAFLKHLYRLSNIVSGKEFYDWDVSGIKVHGHPLIMETKERFKDACPKLYKIIDASYTGYIRDSFAHSLFNVDEDARIIELYSDRVKNDLNLSRLSFDEFQAKFLYTVEFCYELSRMFHETRKALIKDWVLLSKPIPLPDGKILSITEAELLHGEPRFRATWYSPPFYGCVEVSGERSQLQTNAKKHEKRTFFIFFLALFLYHDSLRFPGPHLDQGARKSLIINNWHFLHREVVYTTQLFDNQ